MTETYSRWGVINSTGKFLSQDDEWMYYYQPLDAMYLFITKQQAEDFLNRANEAFKGVAKGEKMNMYSDCKYDPDMRVIEVEVRLRLKNLEKDKEEKQ